MKLGTHQTLNVARKIKHGFILQDTSSRSDDEVLLPSKLAERDLQKGENVRVFLYKDKKERLTATMQEPEVTINHFAFLSVKDITKHGAFLDWGLDKDLFVPHSQQLEDMQQGTYYLIHMYRDRASDRLVASSKLEQFLDQSTINMEEKDEVDLWIWRRTDLGYKVIINEQLGGLIYHNEFFGDVKEGDQTKGYIKNIRPDNKIDVTLRPIGYDKVEPNAKRILRRLKQHNGFLDLHDKSEAKEIHRRLEMSKKTFKKAIGRLYKKDLINIEDDGITLIKK